MHILGSVSAAGKLGIVSADADLFFDPTADRIASIASWKADTIFEPAGDNFSAREECLFPALLLRSLRLSSVFLSTALPIIFPSHIAVARRLPLTEFPFEFFSVRLDDH